MGDMVVKVNITDNHVHQDIFEEELARLVSRHVTIKLDESDFVDTIMKVEVAEFGSANKGTVTPARPFITRIVDDEKLMNNLMNKHITPEKLIYGGAVLITDNIGRELVKNIQQTIDDAEGWAAESSAYTLYKKMRAGIVNPRVLIFTGRMRDAITYGHS